jgi:murein DD-endopeptidase MepM/ murein hydrolase activator NlpD
MPQFDPRLAPTRYAPALLGGAAVAFSALIGAGVATMLHHKPTAGPEVPTVAKMQALEPQALAEAQQRPGLSEPQAVPVKILPGETFEAAVRRTGVAADEARTVVQALARGFDTVNIKAGLAFQAVVAHPREGRTGPAQLIGLSMQTGPASTLTLSRTFDGALRLRELEEQVREETTVAQGRMEGSLYESALKAGADSRMVSQAAKLFAAKLDFSRDIKADDQFRLVFDRKVTESGKTVETGNLLYAEIGAKGQTTRFYRYESKSGAPEFFDETGKNIRGFLLRTPVDGARITSNFGARRHPILGYTRMHQGIDFGARAGTPILSAGAGVVSFSGRAGGYGNQVRVKHQGGWETSYSHMSRFAKGIKNGQRVAQGQVIGYVGSTGMSTGPHLHYEIALNGRKQNPVGAKIPQGNSLSGAELAAFRSQKSKIDAVLAQAATREDAPQQLASLDLRPALR